MQEESWGKERCLVEQQLLGLLFNKSRHMHALLRAPLQSRPKGNAVQSPITQHHSQPTIPGDPTPGTSYHNARPPDLPPGLPCLQANRMCVCLGVLLNTYYPPMHVFIWCMQNLSCMQLYEPVL